MAVQVIFKWMDKNHAMLANTHLSNFKEKAVKNILKAFFNLPGQKTKEVLAGVYGTKYFWIEKQELLNLIKMNKIQSLPEYQGLAARTCPDLPLEHGNERHMNLGVITEIGEVLDIFKKNLAYGKAIDVVNLGEELADISWYIVNKCRFHEIPLVEDFDKVKAEVKELIEHKVFLMPDLPKELKTEALMHILINVYSGQVNSLFNAPIIQLAMLSHIAEWFELDYFQLLTNNIDKLKVRYPEKFTEEAALNRDLEAERVELEKE